MAARTKLREIRDLVIGLLFAAGLIYLFMGIGSVPAPVKVSESTAVGSVAPGSEGQLQNGKPSIPVAIDEELLADLIHSTDAADLGGRVFYVGPQTPVRISETGANGIRIRILSGPQKGRIGWVPSDWVKPL